SYVAIANLWENPNFPLQLHMLGYGFAVFVVPFISEPFLSKSNPLDAGKLQQASVSRIYIPHAGIGALCVLLGIALAITTALVPYPPKPTIAEKTDADTSPKERDKVFETTLVILLAVMSLFCVSLEMTFTGMISSFVIRSDLHLTKSDGAYLGGAFRATFFVGRIIILILHKLPLTLVIVFNLVSALVSSLIFVFFVLSSPYVVWVVNAGLGLGLCAIFGTDIAWVCQYVTLKHWHMAASMVVHS
ncbi:sodium-dependent glucose transporter 1-like, partial [Galendromus occidentalis]|uniref:Sodium-dependent glucose transporter 1-like n=1 Tax=Galendromus occidentalis TaxID=34638 RepID=A0AAJ6QZ27_9ACAR